VRVEALEDGRLELRWDPVYDDEEGGAEQVAGYRIYRFLNKRATQNRPMYLVGESLTTRFLLPKRYDDGGFTGSNTDRPAFQALLRDIQDGHVDVIAVYKIDRLSRSSRDFVRILDLFEQHGVDFVSGLTVTPLGEQYFGEPEDVPGQAMGEMKVTDFGPFPGNSPELGVMLFTNGDRGAGNRGGATKHTEARLLRVVTCQPMGGIGLLRSNGLSARCGR